MNLFYAHTCISGYTNQIVFIIDWALSNVGGNSPQNLKDSFCLPIVVLLPFKRTPFAHQKDSFCNPKGLPFKTTAKHSYL